MLSGGDNCTLHVREVDYPELSKLNGADWPLERRHIKGERSYITDAELVDHPVIVTILCADQLGCLQAQFVVRRTTGKRPDCGVITFPAERANHQISVDTGQLTCISIYFAGVRVDAGQGQCAELNLLGHKSYGRSTL